MMTIMIMYANRNALDPRDEIMCTCPAANDPSLEEVSPSAFQYFSYLVRIRPIDFTNFGFNYLLLHAVGPGRRPFFVNFLAERVEGRALRRLQSGAGQF